MRLGLGYAGLRRSENQSPGARRRMEETVETGARSALAGSSISAHPRYISVNDEASVTNLIRERGKVQMPPACSLAAAAAGQRGENLADLGDMKAAGAVSASRNHAIASARMMRRIMEYYKTICAFIA